METFEIGGWNDCIGIFKKISLITVDEESRIGRLCGDTRQGILGGLLWDATKFQSKHNNLKGISEIKLATFVEWLEVDEH